eukprot:9148043-Pyramimonas_sp.AAC.1
MENMQLNSRRMPVPYAIRKSGIFCEGCAPQNGEDHPAGGAGGGAGRQLRRRRQQAHPSRR